MHGGQYTIAENGINASIVDDYCFVCEKEKKKANETNVELRIKCVESTLWRWKAQNSQNSPKASSFVSVRPHENDETLC